MKIADLFIITFLIFVIMAISLEFEERYFAKIQEIQSKKIIAINGFDVSPNFTSCKLQGDQK